MKLTRDDVLRVAELAHLELSEAEVETYRGQLDAILEYVGKLNQLDTDSVEPMAGGHPSEISGLKSEAASPSEISNLKSEISDLQSRIASPPSSSEPSRARLDSRTAQQNPAFRDDTPWPAPPIDPADALRAAPDAASEPAGAFFRVPKVIER